MQKEPVFDTRIGKHRSVASSIFLKKSELAALDRKITAELAPKHDEKDGEEVRRDEQQQQSQQVENPAQSSGSKESMVADPNRSTTPMFRLLARHIALPGYDTERQATLTVRLCVSSQRHESSQQYYYQRSHKIRMSDNVLLLSPGMKYADCRALHSL